MAKYSTGAGGGGAEGDSCELCGAETSDLRRENVAGATLLVCSDCASHGENRHAEEKRRDAEADRDPDAGENRRKKAARNAARVYDASRADSTHWEEEGTEYEDDRLPYLVPDYGALVSRARQDAGLQREELAAELDVEEADLLAVEQGRATRAGVGGTVVARLEERLDLDLVDE